MQELHAGHFAVFHGMATSRKMHSNSFVPTCILSKIFYTYYILT